MTLNVLEVHGQRRKLSISVRTLSEMNADYLQK
jgi:hypothetical protein